MYICLPFTLSRSGSAALENLVEISKARKASKQCLEPDQDELEFHSST